MSYCHVHLFCKYNIKFWRYLIDRQKLLQITPRASVILNKAEHDSESLVSIYEFTRENTHKYHTHESQVPMSMGFQGSKY